MEDYIILNIKKNKELIIIKNYELKIKDLINIVDLHDINELIIIIDYLPENNKFKSISFSVRNNKVDLNKYTYLSKNTTLKYQKYANQHHPIDS